MLGSGSMQGGPRRLLENFGEHEESHIRGSVLLKLVPFAKPHWRQLLIGGCLMLAATAGGLLIPYLTRHIIDEHVMAGDLPGLMHHGWILGMVMAMTYVAAAGQSCLLAFVGQRILFGLRNRLFAHLQRLSVAYNDRHIVGITVSRVINDVAVINNLLSEGLLTLLGDSILIIGTMVVMLLMEPRLALITFSVLPLMILATVLFGRKARVAFRETREKVGTMVGNLAENITGMRAIQSYAQEGASQRQFERRNEDNRSAHVRAMALSFLFMPVVDVLSVVATCVVLLAGGLMALHGHVTIGIIVAFMTYMSRLFVPIRELSRLYTTLQSATAGGERVLEMLQTEPAVAENPQATDLGRMQGKIELRDLHFAYNTDSQVLKGIDMTVEAGETIAIVGPTGAGKTTITNLLCRFYEPSSGDILIDGRAIQDITPDSLHRQLGFVPQSPFLFADTITANIAYGRDGATGEVIEQAARHAGAHDFITRLPNGYDTHVQEGGVNLSTGQRQLISIARAILVDPRIIIMDEATSSVDTLTESLIQNALAFLLQDRTAVIVAHRLTTVKNADRIYVIEDGRFVEQGSHDDLIQTGGLYRRLYERQFLPTSDSE